MTSHPLSRGRDSTTCCPSCLDLGRVGTASRYSSYLTMPRVAGGRHGLGVGTRRRRVRLHPRSRRRHAPTFDATQQTIRFPHAAPFEFCLSASGRDASVTRPPAQCPICVDPPAAAWWPPGRGRTTSCPRPGSRHRRAWVLSRLADMTSDRLNSDVGRKACGKGSALVIRDQGSLPSG